MKFNEQKARDIAEKCKSRDSTIDHDYWNAHAADVLPAALDRIDELVKALIEKQASKKISKFCHCEHCWPMGDPKPEYLIKAEEKARQEAREQLQAEGLI